MVKKRRKKSICRKKAGWESVIEVEIVTYERYTCRRY